MADYASSALFVYSKEGQDFVAKIMQIPHGVDITPIPIEVVLGSEKEYFQNCQHVVVCAPIHFIKKVMHLAMEYQFSLGLIPLPSQTSLIKNYGLPRDLTEAVFLALRSDPRNLDIVLCNDQIVLFKASIGRIPLVDNPEESSKIRLLYNGLKDLISLRLLPFSIKTEGKNSAKLSTAACGCILFTNPAHNFASRMVTHDSSFTDGLVSMVVVAPISFIDYFRLWFQILTGKISSTVPDSIGFIKSPHINLESENEMNVYIDGEKGGKIPVDCRVIPEAIKMNHGKDLVLENNRSAPGSEKYITKSLPVGKEILKARNKRIPFFTYASEDRFKELFIALRDDARLNSIYLVLMVLSTILATVGLNMNSSSVIIGAMLLAPLMAPIIALAMGILRMDRNMVRQSLWKVFIGIVLAIITAAVITLLSPYQPMTNEMQGRLNPTVLDLIVAIAAGIAGAYTKSYKEILQSLAGVAIAVALVPPLATAGIGIGRLDLYFFSQAFLLFLTNLIGIVMAATITFRVLGFSGVVRGKRGLLVVCFSLFTVSIPLFMAYQSITEKIAFEKSWQIERFYINGKYLIVQDANLVKTGRKKILTVEVLTREQLYRSDLNEFKRKVKKNFPEDLIIRAKLTYIP
ncbi:MAG: putative hydrophobic protein (TIGR00271 family) [Desulforhopalus sp.]|jgi:uncharacterized hydrophobic protein (TIGR00271 family)